MKNSKLEVRGSNISGKGLFATQNIKKAEKIEKIDGKILSLDKFFKLSQKMKDNTIRFSPVEYLSPKNEKTDFLNHSCNPNVRIVKERGKLWLYALRNIKTDEEITMDYSGILARDDYWLMKCNCGSDKCRKSIERFSLMPEKTQKDYIKRMIIPKYILDIKED